jgi:hypothetical protein
MERCSIERLFAMCTQKVFVVRVVRKGNGLSDVVRDLIWLSPASEIDGSEVVTSCDFTRHEEVVLAILSRALSDEVAEFRLSLDSNLCSFIEPEAINVKHCYRYARKVLYLLPYRGNPFSQAVLDGGELGQLALPVGKHAEGFGIAVLREVGG